MVKSSLDKKNKPYKHWQYLDSDTGDRLRIVPERGGLITQWRCNGREVLYFDLERFQLEGKSIRGGIPVLFPISGDLPDNLLTLPQGNFPMNQHGFARDLPWQINTLDDQNGVSLKLKANKQTKLSFPFLFMLEMQVRVEKNALSIKTFVQNVGEEKMPFSFGLHPYFLVSHLDNIAIRGLPVTCQNHLDMKITSTDSQLQKLSKGIDFLAASQGPVSMTDSHTGARIEMHNQYPMDLAVVWTDPPRKMVCVEPWTSPRRSLITTERRLILAPGTSQSLVCRFVSN